MAKSPFEILRQLNTPQQVPSARRPPIALVPSHPVPGGMAGEANIPAQTYDFGSALGSELEERYANTPPTDAYAIHRLKALLGMNEQSMTRSVLPAQRAEYDAFNVNQQNAVREGFKGVTDKAMYDRRIAEEKMRQPIQEQEIIQAGDNYRTRITNDAELAKQRLINEGAADEWRIRNEGELELADKYVKQGYTPRGALIRDPATASVDNTLTRLRNNLAGRDPWDPSIQDRGDVQSYHQALTMALSARRFDEDLIQWALAIMRDPKRRHREDLENFAQITDENGVPDKAAYEQLREILRIAKGGQ